MTEAAGLLALAAGLLAIGLAALTAIGFVRSARAAVLHAGLAVVLGWALTGVALSVGLVLGLSGTVWQIALFWAIAVVVLLGIATRTAPLGGSVRREPSPLGRAIALISAGLLAAWLAELLRRALVSPSLSPDAWGFWLPKARTIYFFGGLDTQPGGFTSYTNADYPPLLPGLEATTYRFASSTGTTVLQVQHWLLFVAFLAAAAALLVRRVRPAIVWPALALLAFLPALNGLVGSSLGDEPLAELFGLAGVAAALWLLERDGRYLWLLAPFLAALPLTKNEGLMLAVVLSVALALTAARRGTWAACAAVVAVPLVAVLPWRVWLSSHDVPSNDAYRFSDLFDPGYLGARWDRLWIGFSGLVHYLFSTDRWVITVPLALAAAALVARRRPALVALLVGTGAVVFLGYAAIYWISPYDIHYYVDTSAARVVAPIVVLCGLALPLLLGEALAEPESGLPRGDPARGRVREP